MKLKSVASGVLISIVLGLLPIQVAQGAEYWAFQKDKAMPSLVNIYIAEGSGNPVRSTPLIIPNDRGFPWKKMGNICAELGEIPCDNINETYNVDILLPKCEEKTQNWCIDKLLFSNAQQNNIPAKFDRYTNGKSYKANAGWGLPVNATTSIWNAPSIPHLGATSEYAVKVSVRAQALNGDFSINYFSASVLPFKIKSGAYKDARVYEMPWPNRTDAFTYGWEGVHPECVWSEARKCGEYANFSADVSVSLNLRVGDDITKWIFGRTMDTEIRVDVLDKGRNLLSVSGKPQSVGVFFASVPKASLAPELKFPQFPDISYSIENSLYTELVAADAIGRSGEVLEKWRGVVSDKAIATNTYWNFGSTPGDHVITNITQCDAASVPKPYGFVSTNATTYPDLPPSFADGQFTYQISGLHYNEKNEVIEGEYTLLIRKEALKCLYGFSQTPTRAEVSILRGDKLDRITTNQVSEIFDSQGSWLKLSLRGFTFSTPTIAVRFFVPEEVGATPLNSGLDVGAGSAKPQESPASKDSSTVKQGAEAKGEAQTKAIAKKKTITCIKGKTTKKVSGSTPKCPTGYKKK